MLDNEKGGTVSRLLLTATDRDWSLQRHDWKPHKTGKDGGNKQTTMEVIPDEHDAHADEATGEWEGLVGNKGSAKHSRQCLETSNQMHRLRGQEGTTKPHMTEYRTKNDKHTLHSSGCNAGSDDSQAGEKTRAYKAIAFTQMDVAQMQAHVTRKTEQIEWLRTQGGAILRCVQHMLREQPQCTEPADGSEDCLHKLVKGH